MGRWPVRCCGPYSTDHTTQRPQPARLGISSGRFAANWRGYVEFENSVEAVEIDGLHQVISAAGCLRRCFVPAWIVPGHDDDRHAREFRIPANISYHADAVQ